MTDALHRISYEATVDDAVDVALRLANRTQTFRRQVSRNIIIVGTAAGLVLIAWWLYTAEGTTPVEFALIVAAGIAFGVIFALIFRRFFQKEIRKQQRQLVIEQFGGKPSIHSELELRPEAVWVRQAGMEMTFPWSICTGVEDNPDDVEMHFGLGICVVRNRDFASPSERQTFLEAARGLAGRSA